MRNKRDLFAAMLMRYKLQSVIRGISNQSHIIGYAGELRKWKLQLVLLHRRCRQGAVGVADGPTILRREWIVHEGQKAAMPAKQALLSKTELYVDRKKGFSRDIRCDIVASDDASNMQLVVFVQEPGPDKVLGRAVQQLAQLP